MILNLMDKENLMHFHKLGLIPGPSEDKHTFEERAHFCLSLKTMIDEALLPKDRIDAPDAILQEGIVEVNREFGIAPSWVPLFFSNQGLMPWHGGSALIFQLQEQGPLGAILQLRKAFYAKACYLGIYKRSELIAHELVHASRMAFEEPKFEELLAYKTSSGGLSKWLGPIIQSAFESRLFVYLLATILLLDLYCVFTGEWEGYLSLMPLKIIPLVLAAWAGFRLWKRTQTLNQTERKLSALYGSTKARQALLFLTDQEIEQCASWSEEEIRRYFSADSSPRMEMLRALTE
jgi:hypothetical protein